MRYSSAALCGLAAALTVPASHAAPPPAKGSVPFDVNRPEVQAEAHKLQSLPVEQPPAGDRLATDHTGRNQAGEASVYATRFEGRHMADARRFHQTGNAAASKTLPIGTVAKVTNLQTGRTATVTVEDRGPFVDGRTVDVSRATAKELGITRKAGVAPVLVAPVAVPQPDGTVKPGAGAAK
jgi:rare lipoprotein A